MSDNGNDNKGNAVFVLKSYLERIEAIENSKPKDNRRDVPGIYELADEIGIHPTSLSRMANGRTESVNLRSLGRIMSQLRRRGFSVTFDDLLAYHDNESI